MHGTQVPDCLFEESLFPPPRRLEDLGGTFRANPAGCRRGIYPSYLYTPDAVDEERLVTQHPSFRKRFIPIEELSANEEPVILELEWEAKAALLLKRLPNLDSAQRVNVGTALYDSPDVAIYIYREAQEALHYGNPLVGDQAWEPL